MEVPSATNNGQHPIEPDGRNEDGVIVPTPAAAAAAAADDADPRRAGLVSAGLPGPARPGPAAVHVRHAPAASATASAGQRGRQGRPAPHVPHGAAGRACRPVCGAEPKPTGLESHRRRSLTGELDFIILAIRAVMCNIPYGCVHVQLYL